MRYVELSLDKFQRKKGKNGIISTTPCVDQESHEVDRRVMMAVHYQGSGPCNIGNTMSFFGVPGGHTIHALFYKITDSFTKKMNAALQVVMNEGLMREIRAKI